MVLGATLGRFGCPSRLPIREKVVPNVARISIYAAPNAEIVLYSPVELLLSLLNHSADAGRIEVVKIVGNRLLVVFFTSHLLLLPHHHACHVIM